MAKYRNPAVSTLLQPLMRQGVNPKIEGRTWFCFELPEPALAVPASKSALLLVDFFWSPISLLPWSSTPT